MLHHTGGVGTVNGLGHYKETNGVFGNYSYGISEIQYFVIFVASSEFSQASSRFFVPFYNDI